MFNQHGGVKNKGRVNCFNGKFTGKIMSNSSKGVTQETELEKEADRAFENVTSTKHKDFDKDFDEEFESAFEIKTSKLNDQTGNKTMESEAKDSLKDEQITDKVCIPVKTEGLPTSLPSLRSVSSERNQEIANQTGTAKTASYHDREPQKHHRRGQKKSSLPPGMRKLPSPPTTLEQAQMEWDMVETVQPGTATSGIASPTLLFEDAYHHFQTAQYLEQHSSHIKPTVRRKGCSALAHALFGPPRLNNDLLFDRDLIFTLALCMYHNDEPLHSSMLQTIYKKLTGTKLDCPRYGNHWELIGFQGLDPATDLRGCGLLGLVNLLYLVTNHHIHPIALDMYRLSQHETQNFPFCVLSINVTRIALQCLREGKLNKICNSKRSVIIVFCDFYVAIFYHIYQVWKHQHKTINDSGFVLKEGEKFALNKPALALKQLQQAVSERKNLGIPEEENVSPKNKEVPVMEKFAGVCELPSHEDEEVHLV